MLYGTGLLLLGAIGGYWVLERAETHKGSLRKIGRVLGAAILVVSLLSLLLKCWAMCPASGGKGFMCPFSRSPVSQPAPTQ